MPSLSHNLGIKYAKNEFILRLDADASPNPDLMNLTPGDSYFFAGDWHAALSVSREGSIHGQCIFSKSQFLSVNGYSEVIRSYGYEGTYHYKV